MGKKEWISGEWLSLVPSESECISGTSRKRGILVAGVFRLLRAAVHGQELRLRQNDVVGELRAAYGSELTRRITECAMKRTLR